MHDVAGRLKLADVHVISMTLVSRRHKHISALGCIVRACP